MAMSSNRPYMFTYSYSLVIELYEENYRRVYMCFCIKRKAFNSLCHRNTVRQVIIPCYPYKLFDIRII